MDEDPGEERPKPVQHCDVVKLQQQRGGPDRKQWIKQHFGHAFEFVSTKVTRRSEIRDRKRYLESCGKPTAPLPDRIRRWLYREQQPETKPVHPRPLVHRFR